MNIIKQYKTFNKETGEIRVDCKIVGKKHFDELNQYFQLIQNGEIQLESKNIEEVVDYYEKLKQMDYYIASGLEYYEVYTIIYQEEI